MPRLALKAFRASIRSTGEEIGLYHVEACGDTPRERGRAYHLAYLDLKGTRYPQAKMHADVPGLSVRRAPSEDEYV